VSLCRLSERIRDSIPYNPIWFSIAFRRENRPNGPQDIGRPDHRDCGFGCGAPSPARGTPPVASSAWCKVIRVHCPAAAPIPNSPPAMNSSISSGTACRMDAKRRLRWSASRKQRSLDNGRSFWRRGGISRLVLLVQTCWFRTREESSDPSTFVISAASWSCW
jgi:hypothetical protein